MKKSVCLSQDSNLGSQIYLYGLIQPIRGRNRVKAISSPGIRSPWVRRKEIVTKILYF